MSNVTIMVRDANGVDQPVSATNPLPIGEYAGGGATTTYTEDAAAAGNPSGSPLMLVREDARAGSLTTTDGDMVALRGNNKGEAYVIDTDAVAQLTVLAAALAAIQGHGTTITSSAARMTDTTAYASNDAWANSDSAPTAGGYTLTGMARASGGSGLIDDILIVSSNDPATLLQGELWIFDSAPTAVNDNAAFALSDADALKLVAVIPFTLVSTTAGSGTNSCAHVFPAAPIGYTCVGSANLRYLVKVKNAYTPASGETLTVRAKVRYTT